MPKTTTPPWKKKNPNKKSKPLSSGQKAAAKARAEKAGRPYPNLVDNMWASKNSQERTMCAKCGCGCKAGKPAKGCKCTCATCKAAKKGKK